MRTVFADAGYWIALINPGNDALNLYEQRPDQAWSHTDCASFLIMQQRNIPLCRRKMIKFMSVRHCK